MTLSEQKVIGRYKNPKIQKTVLASAGYINRSRVLKKYSLPIEVSYSDLEFKGIEKIQSYDIQKVRAYLYDITYVENLNNREAFDTGGGVQINSVRGSATDFDPDINIYEGVDNFEESANFLESSREQLIAEIEELNSQSQV